MVVVSGAVLGPLLAVIYQSDEYKRRTRRLTCMRRSLGLTANAVRVIRDLFRRRSILCEFVGILDIFLFIY